MKRKITCSRNGDGLNNDIRIVLQTFYGDFHWHSGSLSIVEYWFVFSFQRCAVHAMDGPFTTFIKWCD